MLPIDRKAYTIRSDNYPTIIIINGRYEPKSQLVLCAHELGQALLHSDDIYLIARRPPRATRTDTHLPYTTVCRSTAEY